MTRNEFKHVLGIKEKKWETFNIEKNFLTFCFFNFNNSNDSIMFGTLRVE